MVWADLKLAEQQQDEQHHQNQSAEPHSRMAHALSVAAETAAEAAQQDDDQDDNEDQAERHVHSPWARRSTHDDRKPADASKHIAGSCSMGGTVLSLRGARSPNPESRNILWRRIPGLRQVAHPQTRQLARRGMTMVGGGVYFGCSFNAAELMQ